MDEQFTPRDDRDQLEDPLLKNPDSRRFPPVLYNSGIVFGRMLPGLEWVILPCVLVLRW